MKVLAGFGLIAALMFAAPLLGVLGGAFSGWVVGLFFADTVLAFVGRLGIDTTGLAMWQLGASLGFIGAFFKSTFSNTSK